MCIVKVVVVSFSQKTFLVVERPQNMNIRNASKFSSTLVHSIGSLPRVWKACEIFWIGESLPWRVVSHLGESNRSVQGPLGIDDWPVASFSCIGCLARFDVRRKEMWFCDASNHFWLTPGLRKSWRMKLNEENPLRDSLRAPKGPSSPPYMPRWYLSHPKFGVQLCEI